MHKHKDIVFYRGRVFLKGNGERDGIDLEGFQTRDSKRNGRCVSVCICLNWGMYSICICPLCKHLSVVIHLSSCPPSILTQRMKENLWSVKKSLRNDSPLAIKRWCTYRNQNLDTSERPRSQWLICDDKSGNEQNPNLDIPQNSTGKQVRGFVVEEEEGYCVRQDGCSLPLKGAKCCCNALSKWRQKKSYPWQIPVVISFVLHWSKPNQRAACCAGWCGIAYRGLDSGKRCCSAYLEALC